VADRAKHGEALTEGAPKLPSRPMPPPEVVEPDPEVFAPAPDVAAWLHATFIDPGAPLTNPEHEHLGVAQIGVIWTNVPNMRKMRGVAAQAEIPQGMGGVWIKGRQAQQFRDWFGFEPDFVITIDAPLAATLSDVQFCALAEHELLHCGQARDAYDLPRFNKDGIPVFAIRGHDVEEFVSVVRRYGMVGAHVAQLVDAANSKPELDISTVEWACGTCGRAP
jgi:hypothetical protein